jgi:sugar lactone lactonase YvrE
MPQPTGPTGPSSVIYGDWIPLGTERYELGEGARWIAGRLYFVDLLAGRLLACDPHHDFAPTEVLHLDVPLGAIAPTTDGGYLVAADTGIARFVGDDRLDWLSRQAENGPTPLRVNDAAADLLGRFWFGAMAWDNRPDAGALYRRDIDGSVHTALTSLTIPNGPVFTSDGATMYLADTAHSVIHAFPVDEDGNLGEPRVFADVDGNPDGMTLDAEGCLWTAIWDGGRIHRYAPDGTIAVPASQPTSGPSARPRPTA